MGLEAIKVRIKGISQIRFKLLNYHFHILYHNYHQNNFKKITIPKNVTRILYVL